MRASTKLGIAALLTGAALEAVAAGIALALKAPTEVLGWADFTVHAEAAISLNLVSRAALATGIIALLYTAYKLLIVRPEEAKDAIERLGGSWIPSGPGFSPPRATRLTGGERDGGYGYRLVAYRQE